ncbi:uncharacterized protein K444DRAFT_528894, partial [Hyaloscypha bicolor E]
KLISYLKYIFYLNCLGQDAGFKNRLISYYFRRDYTNIINSMYPNYIINFLEANSYFR